MSGREARHGDPGQVFEEGLVFAEKAPSNAPWNAARGAQVKLVGDNPLVAWVDRDDLNGKRKKSGEAVDDRQNTAEEYEWLGRPFSRQAKALIEGRQSARDGRP